MIELKYFERSDFKQLINWVDSPSFLLQWGGPGFNYPLNDSQLEKYMENANHTNSEALIYKVVDQETSNVIGHISLGRIDRKNESARVGKVLIGDLKNFTYIGLVLEYLTLMALLLLVTKRPDL